ncbi:hypothetical protein GHT06_008823 [Daphnia sinensis]|uniref:Uncharacterized protein n=1 Tax=Daphnia sinensis TaxID=1820382 RepID=A0AAD5LMP3_9CRUS|nr:hypothetical protein GHT06_008823 [Daphnia sinensis]
MFVCEMYGIKNQKGQLKKQTVNEARLELFTKVYQSTTKRPMSKVKGIDGSSLPPCKSVLQQQINRANCICSAWNFAFTLSPNVLSPKTSGWNIEKDDERNERYSVNWFEGDLAPQTLEEVLQKLKTTESEIREEANDDEEGDDEDESEQESDEDESASEEEKHCSTHLLC